MTPEQQREWDYLVECCKDSTLGSINVASKSRRVAIVAADEQLEKQSVLLTGFAEVARGLIAYRDNAGALGFQLEKADGFINLLRRLV